jgi:protein TonB
MPSESRNVSEERQDAGLGSLQGCLVEGDAEQRTRERRVRRRALVISISLQSVFLAVLVLVPLFGKTERLALGKQWIPIPPYGHPPHRAAGATGSRADHHLGIDHHLTFPSPTSRPAAPSNAGDDGAGPPIIDETGTGSETGPACSWCVNTGDRDSGPRPPQPAVQPLEKPRILHVTQLDPARLVRRVEPDYPILAKQTHREGRVELHAIIATDGTIQSLEIISGDPIFYLSAREAVSQWRYQPTILNGQPVEIDTHITVIYTMRH